MRFLYRVTRSVAYRFNAAVNRLRPLPNQQSTELPVLGIDHRALRRREISAMQERFPRLAEFMVSTDLDEEKQFGRACELIAQIHPDAAEAYWRNILRSLGTEAAEREIAESDLREGIPFSGNVRRYPDIWKRALPQVREHEEAYGAAVFTGVWPSLGRGRAVAWYYENHPPTGRVLHVAPEPEAESLFRRLPIEYHTMGLGADTDLAEDITELDIESESYDLVVCHRVLEHVFDEDAALAELRRILRPGGVLNVSVPESMHLSDALEWCIPDITHHGHYRHYGRDFASRLQMASFEVECERWLLDQPAGKVRAAGTYPLRMYNAVKN
jgi:hypothetical protein